MISIVNYGLGNVQAIANIYQRLNIDVCITSTAEELRLAKRSSYRVWALLTGR